MFATTNTASMLLIQSTCVDIQIKSACKQPIYLMNGNFVAEMEIF